MPYVSLLENLLNVYWSKVHQMRSLPWGLLVTGYFLSSRSNGLSYVACRGSADTSQAPNFLRLLKAGDEEGREHSISFYPFYSLHSGRRKK